MPPLKPRSECGTALRTNWTRADDSLRMGRERLPPKPQSPPETGPGQSMTAKFPLLTLILILALSSLVGTAPATDTFIPYNEDNVPGNVVDLWKDVDARKDALETEIVKEWVEDGVVCRYVIFKVGTFKGADSRIAAFYTFPEGAEKLPAIVWAHGGGQRAELEHGKYFAKHGYAMVDINWGGREMVEGMEKNTDWGAVDPSQGPQFYPGAKRPGTKLTLVPDEFTIDTVVSPRNGNWFLLAYAGRRAITFLERQPEVDPEKIGFTGYSMGGNITSYVAIDERLKAVAPMVGGTGFITSEFPGIPGNTRALSYRGHVDLFAKTMESQSYYPHVKCPVLLLTASNDFHGITDRAYTSMATLPHRDWRVSLNMHFNHNLGAQQWILLSQWFDKYLKGEVIDIPQTAESDLVISDDAGSAVFTAKPDQADQLAALDIYYSYDPNPQTRYWKLATAVTREGDTWRTTLPLHAGLPLFAFADCTYPLGAERESFRGTTSTFTITSSQQVHLPGEWRWENLAMLGTGEDFTPTFAIGWGENHGGGLVTYKFRDPEMKLPGADQALRLKLNGIDGRYGVRLRVTRNFFLTGVKGPKEDYVANLLTQPGESEFVFSLAQFLNAGKQPMPDWTNITTLSLDIIQSGVPLKLRGNPILQSLDWTTAKPGQ